MNDALRFERFGDDDDDDEENLALSLLLLSFSLFSKKNDNANRTATATRRDAPTRLPKLSSSSMTLMFTFTRDQNRFVLIKERERDRDRWRKRNNESETKRLSNKKRRGESKNPFFLEPALHALASRTNEKNKVSAESARGQLTSDSRDPAQPHAPLALEPSPSTPTHRPLANATHNSTRAHTL